MRFHYHTKDDGVSLKDRELRLFVFLLLIILKMHYSVASSLLLQPIETKGQIEMNLCQEF